MFGFLAELVGAIHVETPKYKVLKGKQQPQQEGKSAASYEIRRYPPLVMIKTPHASMQETGGFRRLASFIFGYGQAPGTKPAPIAMTAPVVSTHEYMSFILPQQYDTPDKVPMPHPELGVTVEAVEEMDYAMSSFSGSGRAQMDVQLTALTDALDRDGIAWVPGSQLLNQYNPPWCLTFLRLNEVGVRLANRFEGSAEEEGVASC